MWRGWNRAGPCGAPGTNPFCVPAFLFMLSRLVVSDFATLWTVARQASMSMGILQARILEWVAISSSRQSSQHRDQTWVSWIAGRLFTLWATGEGWVPKGRFRQLPITEGRGRWGKGGAAKKQECSLGGQGPGSPPRGTHSNVSLAL